MSQSESFADGDPSNAAEGPLYSLADTGPSHAACSRAVPGHASGDAARPPLADARRVHLDSTDQGSDIKGLLRPMKPQCPIGNIPGMKFGARATYLPKFSLEGKTWIVAHQKNNHEIKINYDDVSQSISMHDCVNSTMEVNKKMNFIVIDSCNRSSVFLQEVSSSVAIKGCRHVKIKLDEPVKLICIENCESIKIVLTPRSKKVEIISSNLKSCEVCLMEADGNIKTFAVPEKIRSVLWDDVLKSTAVEKL